MDIKTKVAAFLRKELRIARVFDQNYYNSVYLDISENDIKPLKHFLEHGLKEERHPNALFDPKYYREKYLDGDRNINPLVHYLSKAGWKNNPHPLFDVDYYVSQLGEGEKEVKGTYLEHFIEIGWTKGYSPSPFFDVAFYLSQNKDVERENVNPFIHYLTFGEREGRLPSPFFDPSLYKKPDRRESENYAAYHAKSKLEFYALGKSKMDCDYVDFTGSLAQLVQEKPVVVFVSHEGTRTGAPLIILEIAKRFKANYDIQPVNILLAGGEVTADFDEIGPTYVTMNSRFSGNQFGIEMKTVISRIGPENVVGVMVNSAESRNILPYVQDFGVPVLSLVHEFAEFYPENSWQVIEDYSDVVIFPSQVVKQKALEFAPFDPSKVIVKGQGLLNERFLKLDREAARKTIIKQIPRIKEDTIIVLGCGTADPRKGIDFFVNIGLSYFANKDDDRDVVFLWLGKLVDNHHLNWSLKDVSRAEQENRIIFPGPVADTAPFFVGSDIFLMTSRADPFPCVVHEAMAARLPIICFEGGGGFVEALDGNAGIVLPYGDFFKTTQELNKLVQNEAHRLLIGTNARNRLIQHYDFKDYSEFLGRIILSGNGSVKRNLLSRLVEKIGDRGARKHSEAKTVIFTLPSWEAVSGVNTFIENVIIELRKQGYDAYILFTYVKESTLQKEEERLLPKVPYRFLNTKKDDSGYSCESIWKSLRVYLELNSPCVFVPNYDYIASALSSDLSDDIGILGALHSDDIEHYEHAYRLGRYWNHTVFVSNRIKEKMLTLNPMITSRSSVIPYGVKTPISSLDEIEKPDNPLSIIYTGRIVQHQKRILDFVEIIKRLDSKHPNFTFTFVGDGPEIDQLTEALADFIVDGRVRLLGRQDKEVVYKELAASHVFALFSDFEGLPLSILEALSMGCVPVVTDIESGIKEIIQHGENGLVSPLGDVDAFVANLTKLANDQKLLRRLSTKSFNTLEQYGLTTKLMGEKYAQLIAAIFYEIEAGTYERPEAITFGSVYGNILVPPMYQEVRRLI